MAWNKKGEEAGGIAIWFAIFYSLLTAGVALALVFMPKALMEKNIQPILIDQAVQAQQIESRLWLTNAFTGRTNPFEYRSDLDDVNQTYTTKLITYKVTLDGKSSIYDEPFYKIAVPLANFKYQPYIESRTVSVNGKQTDLIVEELYPQNYAIKTT